MRKPKTAVLFLESDEILRAGAVSVLEADGRFSVGRARNAAEARLEWSLRPSVLVLPVDREAFDPYAWLALARERAGVKVLLALDPDENPDDGKDPDDGVQTVTLEGVVADVFGTALSGAAVALDGVEYCQQLLAVAGEPGLDAPHPLRIVERIETEQRSAALTCTRERYIRTRIGDEQLILDKE